MMRGFALKVVLASTNIQNAVKNQINQQHSPKPGKNHIDLLILKKWNSKERRITREEIF